jgi:hypothetical protein
MGRITIFNIFGVVIFAAMGAAVCAVFGVHLLWGAATGAVLGFGYPITGRVVVWMLNFVDRPHTKRQHG